MCRDNRRCNDNHTPEQREEDNAHRRLQYLMSKKEPLTPLLYQRHLNYAYHKTEALHAQGIHTLNYHGLTDRSVISWNLCSSD